ncbi:cysteine desulfurase family protein [Planctomycetes bacterium K23_9]|uniref:cysteine desulfurase n=1 Tax=Stieleria marina TaxID=1930275 RepID=A0A517P0Z5_9BACT|nr:Cysteine desulfurase [Planctomycetes bacterium K23_9]
MIYLDNHASTRCDPRVIEAMMPWLSEHYGNPHSGSHAFGRQAAEGVDAAAHDLSKMLGVEPESIVFTSGATESNNLAIRGVCLHPRQKRRHIVTVTTEHPAVLDVFSELENDGFRVTHVPVLRNGDPNAGVVDLNQLAEAVDDDTALVSIMWANNEIGAIAPISEIADICHERGALLHSDATQAVGRIPVDAKAADVDLLSATAHKFYGPKGSGILVVGNSNRRVRLKPQVTGGGQQNGLRSGTVNPAGAVGIAAALQLCVVEMEQAHPKTLRLRKQLFDSLAAGIEGLQINGPELESEHRLAGNLNMILPSIEGAAWISATPEVAFSSGSACSSVESKPSHVLTAIGNDESQARRSVRFGVGRFNTTDEIEQASTLLTRSYREVAQLG